jgi:hypothetical protein
MAYMNQERKAARAPAIKDICKRYGIKASLSIRNHSTLVLNIKSGAIDFIGNCNATISAQPGGFRNGSPATTYLDVNPYWYQEHFTGTALAFLSEVIPALYGTDYFDESDAQTDYFHCSHYIDINIGRWDCPYVLGAV